MQEREQLTRQFHERAGHLMGLVVRPRVLKLASMFPNAQALDKTTRDYCRCRFEYTPDYPADARLEFGVALQNPTASALVTYCLEIEPVRFDTLSNILELRLMCTWGWLLQVKLSSIWASDPVLSPSYVRSLQ